MGKIGAGKVGVKDRAQLYVLAHLFASYYNICSLNNFHPRFQNGVRIFVLHSFRSKRGIFEVWSEAIIANINLSPQAVLRHLEHASSKTTTCIAYMMSG
jgi:hypothetical protein